MRSAPKPRSKYYMSRTSNADLNLANLPPPGIVSIIHRISGALLFFPAIPILLYVLQSSLTSEDGYQHWRQIFAMPVVKLIVIGFAWLYAHHFYAGIRYLLLDVHIGVAKEPSRSSAIVVLVLGLVTAALIGWCLW
jgi:succinate dehydrogenase / fumarate reductase, cytochrome b subunit